MPVSRATWLRGRGWALWKALIVFAQAMKEDLANVSEPNGVIAEVLAAHKNAE